MSDSQKRATEKYREKQRANWCPLTLERLGGFLSYNPLTGALTWKVTKARMRFGEEAGSGHGDGYLSVQIDGKGYYAHRLAWALHHGQWPSSSLDHRNGNRSDNRILNLREADKSGQGANMRVMRNGLKGATFHRRIGRWQAQITKNRKVRSLGYFETEAEAHKAYRRAALELHGEFARFV